MEETKTEGEAVPEAPSNAPRAQIVMADGYVIRPIRTVIIDAVARALSASAGNVSQAAELLGVGRATIYRYVRICSQYEGRINRSVIMGWLRTYFEAN